MSADGSVVPRRLALKIALVYLLVRGLSELLLYGLDMLSVDTLELIAQVYGAWMGYVYPILPTSMPSVPVGFQRALALLPVLAVEGLLAFLFSAALLRRKPWAAHGDRGTARRGWIALVTCTLIWSVVIRHQLLAYVHGDSIKALLALQTQPEWMDELPYFLMKARATLMGVMYLTAPLWAGLPVWLYFRLAGASKPAPLEAHTSTSSNTVHVDGVQASAPLQRACLFAGFLLGCLALHILFLEVVYMVVWPWTVASLKIVMTRSVLGEMDLPLTMSQVIFGSLAYALAAYVYARRPATGTPTASRLFLTPVAAGAAAYMLTCLILLAFTWVIAWTAPDAAAPLLAQLGRSPQRDLMVAVALGISALLVLCFVSGRLRQSPRRWAAILGVLLLIGAVPGYLGWTLIGTRYGVAGATPGMAVTGTLGDARWRNMEQWCTGVVETRHGTWLVGRTDDVSDEASYVPTGTPDLGKLVVAEDEQDTPTFGSRPTLTTLARLQEDGRFKLVATVPEVACLVVSPESETLFLLTGIDLPNPPDSLVGSQSAVFRSTDHGTTWEWLKSGFMAQTDQIAWSVAPTFVPGKSASDQQVWAWSAEPTEDEDADTMWGTPLTTAPRQAADGTELKPSALHYSADQGKTSSPVLSPAPLIATEPYLKTLTGQADADFSGRRDMDQKRFVVQVDDKRAYAWTSEFMWYSVGEDRRPLMLTTQAELDRSGPDGQWQISKVTRQPGVQIAHLSTSRSGQTFAVLQDENGETLAKLDPATGTWIDRHAMPSLLPAWAGQNRVRTRYFHSNGDYQVVSLWGDVQVSRALIPFLKKRADISIEAHFYTRDGGRSWKQLAVPGYLGVMGLSPQGSKLYWNQGNWYTDNEPVQREYDLAK